MSSSNCCFLTCIQISKEAGQVVWYSHLFQNFPQYVVIHIVKGFDILNKAEVKVFLELSCFFDDPTDVGNMISGSSAFGEGNGTPLQYSCWKIQWTEEPGRLQSVGSLGVRHDWATSLSLFTFMHWRRKCQPTPVFLPGESQGRGSLVGCHLLSGSCLPLQRCVPTLYMPDVLAARPVKISLAYVYIHI